MDELLGAVSRLFHILHMRGQERSLNWVRGNLCPNFQNIFESHTCGSEFALQKHDNIVVVFLHLLSEWFFGVLALLTLDERLQGGYLFVDIGNVLLNYIGEFLRNY
jgi:hypothetical protein